MASTVQTMTKARLSFEHQNKTYWMSPLEPADLAMLELWVQELPFERANRQLAALGDQCTEAVRAQVIERAMQESESLRLHSAEAQQALASLQGVA